MYFNSFTMGILKYFLVLLPFFGATQAPFLKLYAGNGFDRGEGVVQLEDSSYIVTGTSGSWGGSSQIFLMNVDSLGNYKWSKQYGGEESEEGRRVFYNKDLGLFVAGTSNSYGNGDFDVYLFNTDKNGVFNWHKNYGDAEHWEKVNDAVMTADSGMFIVGEKLKLNGGNVDWYILRTNKNGDTLWTKSWGGTGEDRANAVIEKDGNYWVGGEAYIAQNDVVRGIVLRINDNGEIISGDTLNDLNRKYAITGLAKGLDRIYFCGYREVSAGVFDAYTGSLNFDGSLISHYTITNTASQDIFDKIIYSTSTNSVLIAYKTINSGTYQDDFDNYFAFFDPINVFWLNNFRGMNNEGRDQTNQIIETVDGGLMTVGFNTNTGLEEFNVNGGESIFLLKISNQSEFPLIQGVVNLNQLVSTSEHELVQLKIYPNPVDDYLKFETNSVIRNAQLTDFQGKILWIGDIQNQTSINCESLTPGLYLLKIGNQTIKVMKI